MLDPPDPSSLDPLIGSWPAGRSIVRVHTLGRGPAEFARGGGAIGRFHPLSVSDDSVIPWLYGAEDDEGAICETVLHDIPFVLGARLTEARLAGRAIATIAPHRDLRLVELRGLGLRRLGLRRTDIVDTLPTAYPKTTRWAQALHDCPAHPDGLLWQARPDDAKESLVLFGDRVGEDEFDVIDEPILLALGEGLDRVRRVLTLAGIVLLPVED